MTQPLYFLPGLMCDKRLWQAVWPHLSNDHNPTHISFGLHHTMAPMLGDISQNLHLEPADLIGFSMGGYLALRYAIDHPQAIKRLIIIGATGKSLTEQEQIQRDHILRFVKANDYSGIPTKRIAQFVHPDNLNTPVSDVIRAMDTTLGKQTLVAQLESSSKRASLLEQAHTLDFPVLVVGAEQDELVSVEEITQLANSFSNAQLTIIKDCGHMIPLEAPKQLAQIINDFLLESEK